MGRNSIYFILFIILFGSWFVVVISFYFNFSLIMNILNILGFWIVIFYAVSYIIIMLSWVNYEVEKSSNIEVKK
jgi:hypothetical protein